MKAKGIDEGAGLTRRLAHGATLGADSTLMAGLFAPVEAIKRGVDLGDYAKAREDQILSDARRNTGALGTATELLGGGVAGGGLAQGGVTAARLLSSAPSLAGRTLATAADAAGLGGFSGAMEGNGLSERAANAGQGALTDGIPGAVRSNFALDHGRGNGISGCRDRAPKLVTKTAERLQRQKSGN